MTGATSQERLLLISGEPAFVWSSLVLHFGLPAVPEWADWCLTELNSKKKLQPLMGFGYTGVAVKTNRQELLRLIEFGLRKKELIFPNRNGPVRWHDDMEHPHWP
jgi:hypothetical protein